MIDLEMIGQNIDDSFFIIGVIILAIEIVKGLLNKTLKWRGFADMCVNISTQIPFLLIEIFILSFFYGLYVVISENYISWQMEINIFTIVFSIIVADFLYYWEHRLAHELRFLWIHHAVHHSSRHMNITTGLRFGPFEGIWSMVAIFPMVIMGFAPELIILGSLTVLAYQTWIHTELIGKLGVIELLFNTPSHHRVHHGCDKHYLDKNYGGIFIIWDRIFGSFQEENKRPYYGLTRDFDSINPFKVWFSELPAFFTDLTKCKNWKDFKKSLTQVK
jgi:sterol desaturase/sphingolipid hydroxylase (fatty acid hydroxylase superfamily)